MIGILVEKHTAKKNFSKALGGSKGKFNGEDYLIVSSSGHLYEFTDPETQVSSDLRKKYSSWDINNLPWNHTDFKWKYKKKPGADKYLKEIKEGLQRCSEICIATDIDPSGEGDLIAGEIILNLKLTKGKKISRMEFVDESVKSLQKAFIERRTVKSIESELSYQKALFRSKWDFLSMQFTRISTKVSPIKAVIRQGRLKSIMVFLVGEALKELDKYEEIPYFQNIFIDENNIKYTNSKEKKYNKKEDVPNIYKKSEVILDKISKKTSPPPQLLDLAKLSARLSSKGYSAKEIKNTYQKMYLDGIVSYPRTTDKNITNEQFNDMLPLVDKIANLVDIDLKILTHRQPRNTHVQDKGAHGANRPGLNVPKSLSELTKYGRSASDIYILLSRNFLSMFAENYEYEKHNGYIKDYPQFKGSTNVPVKLGWKNIFKIKNDNITTGLGKIGKPSIHKGYPPKPPTPTMLWLMDQLDKYNVGSGSTRTTTYIDVTNQKTKYPLLIDNKGKISMTTCGIISYQLLINTKIGDISITEKVFNTMDSIAKGNIDIINTQLAEVATFVQEDINNMQINSKNIVLPEYKKIEKETMKNKEGKEISFKTQWGSHKFTKDEIEKLKNGETISIKNYKNKKGKYQTIKGRIEKQKHKGYVYYGFKAIEFINK